MFKFVLIPAANDPVEEISKSKSGGLEADELRIHAESYFSAGAESMGSSEKQKEEMKAMLAQQGIDASTLDPALFEKLPQLGGSVEILSLLLPTAANGFVSISMYCDRNGQAKNLPLNVRASSICQVCAVQTAVYGDAFIGRAHDDESIPWVRMDFTQKDISADAQWIRYAAEKNKGKNMGSYTTSGQMENMANQQMAQASAGAAKKSGKGTLSPSSVAAAAAQLPVEKAPEVPSWNQSGEEVEIKVRLPVNAKKKDLVVKIQSNKLQLSFKNRDLLADYNHRNEVDRKIIFGGGADLFDRIDVDSSTWNMETIGAEQYIVFSLAKQKEGTWAQPLK